MEINEVFIKSLIDVAVETFRFEKVFKKVISNLDAEEQSRYFSHYVWFAKKIDSALEEAGFSTVNLEGQQYDPGMAVTPINIEDFKISDQLYVEQMLEPIVMRKGSVAKSGTVILGVSKK
jgi:hypothetical protein